MARTNTPKPKEPTRAGREIKYRGFTACRMSSGEIWVLDSYSCYVGKAENRSDFETMVDFKLSEREEPKKSRRTIPPKKGNNSVNEYEFPRGGHIKNPISDCEHKIKFEKGGNWWVECVVCSFYCKNRDKCPTYREFETGKRERIRLMNEGSKEKEKKKTEEFTEKKKSKRTKGVIKKEK